MKPSLRLASISFAVTGGLAVWIGSNSAEAADRRTPTTKCYRTEPLSAEPISYAATGSGAGFGTIKTGYSYAVYLRGKLGDEGAPRHPSLSFFKPELVGIRGQTTASAQSNPRNKSLISVTYMKLVRRPQEPWSLGIGFPPSASVGVTAGTPPDVKIQKWTSDEPTLLRAISAEAGRDNKISFGVGGLKSISFWSAVIPGESSVEYKSEKVDKVEIDSKYTKQGWGHSSFAGLTAADCSSINW